MRLLLLAAAACAGIIGNVLADPLPQTGAGSGAAAAFIQNDAAAPLEFEVATVRPHPAGDFVSSLGGPPGRYEAKNVTVKQLVEEAFGVPSDQVSGGPDWTDKQRFDVQAKIPDAEWQKIGKLDYDSREQFINLMLQSLLRDRFQLSIKKEPRELKVYALVVAKGGPKLRPAGSPKPASSDEEGKSYSMAMDQPDIPTAQLANFIQGFLGHTVLDRTGLSGRFDINFGVPVEKSAIDVESSLFRALEDQLGLKIESVKATVDTIVIERLEKPSEN